MTVRAALGALLATATTVAALSSGCSAAPSAVPPPDEHSEFDFLLHAGSAGASSRPAPRSFSSSVPRVAPSPPASATTQADDAHDACRSKMGSSLAVKLQAPASSHTKLNVTVEFVSEQDDDEVPGLGFVRPGVAVGALTLAAIAKLCQHPDLKWIDATPIFMGGP